MSPDLIVEELSIASAGIDELKTVDVWAVLMTFITILILDKSYSFQNDLKNILNKGTTNMEGAFKQQLQKKAYPSFSLKYLPVQAIF